MVNSFILKVVPLRGTRSSTNYEEFEGDEAAARIRAQERLAADGVSEVEVFQRINNGRLTKKVVSDWSS